MSRKARYVIVTILILGSIGAIAGYRIWNKPPEKIEDVNGLSISATQLAKEFSEDEPKANEKYLEKALEVTGVVGSVEANQEGGNTVILETGDPMIPVVCSMRDKAADVAEGSTITVSGFCSGNVMGVSLTGCVIK